MIILLQHKLLIFWEIVEKKSPMLQMDKENLRVVSCPMIWFRGPYFMGCCSSQFFPSVKQAEISNLKDKKSWLALSNL